ncbi:unnamed protein product [Arabis nemorensis]|uniref:Protein ABIL4 n=1 Tax=Arabis nemorensis TaxID=586526 RepID=A0A565B864_9BRAS|nr:unnamed protein product [Arabis nemorensis]
MASSTTSLAIVLHQSSNHDELFMKQTLQFSETLKDLKNLRKQLYSAADYFETSYGKEEHKETVIETLKEYAAKAVVNTVDHLGSVSDKFNSFLSDNTSNFSTTHLRLSSLEQSPHHHKRYFFPRMYTLWLSLPIRLHHHSVSSFIADSCIQEQGRIDQRGMSFSAGDDSHRFKSAVRATILENQPNTARKANKTGSFSFSPNIHNKPPPSKRTNSPMRFPLLRSGSLLKRSSSPSQPRKLEPQQRAVSVSRNTEIVEIKQSSMRKGKKSLMLKALMSMSKSRN